MSSVYHAHRTLQTSPGYLTTLVTNTTPAGKEPGKVPGRLGFLEMSLNCAAFWTLYVSFCCRDANSLAKINKNKKIIWIWLTCSCHSPSLREAMKECCFLAHSPACSLAYIAQNPCLGNSGLFHSGLCAPTSIINQENPSQTQSHL